MARAMRGIMWHRMTACKRRLGSRDATARYAPRNLPFPDTPITVIRWSAVAFWNGWTRQLRLVLPAFPLHHCRNGCGSTRLAEKRAATGHLPTATLDAAGTPTPVPRVLIETEEERTEYAAKR